MDSTNSYVILGDGSKMENREREREGLCKDGKSIWVGMNSVQTALSPEKKRFDVNFLKKKKNQKIHEILSGKR